MQSSELRWISPVDLLDVKQPTRMKLESVSNYVINYMCIGETFYMLVTTVFCEESVLTAQVVANTKVEIILFSL